MVLRACRSARSTTLSPGRYVTPSTVADRSPGGSCTVTRPCSAITSSGVAAAARASIARTAGSCRAACSRSSSENASTCSSSASSISVESNRLPRLSGASCGWSGSMIAAPSTASSASRGQHRPGVHLLALGDRRGVRAVAVERRDEAAAVDVRGDVRGEQAVARAPPRARAPRRPRSCCARTAPAAPRRPRAAPPTAARGPAGRRTRTAARSTRRPAWPAGRAAAASASWRGPDPCRKRTVPVNVASSAASATTWIRTRSWRAFVPTVHAGG